MGESQEFYSRLGAVQNNITVLMAEVEEVGESVWDLVSDKAGSSISFTRFQATKDALLEAFQGLIATQSRTPTLSQISSADQLAWGIREMVDFAKRMAPEIAAKVDARGASVEAAVSASPLQSPSDVGWDEFERQMKDRASKLVPSISTTTLVAAVAAVAGLMYFMSRR